MRSSNQTVHHRWALSVLLDGLHADGGVPLKAPVAGIAMGLVKEGERFQVLTDILGDEDHLGDMDFKVAGTKDGITIQMDIKIKGLTREIVEKSMQQARDGRLHILDEMAKTISSGRDELKGSVPKIYTSKIKQDEIGALIGPGGKNIKKLRKLSTSTSKLKKTVRLNLSERTLRLLKVVRNL